MLQLIMQCAADRMLIGLSQAHMGQIGEAGNSLPKDFVLRCLYELKAVDQESHTCTLKQRVVYIKIAYGFFLAKKPISEEMKCTRMVRRCVRKLGETLETIPNKQTTTETRALMSIAQHGEKRFSR
jgi:cystathionine beta-lyase family protein involved in aluminum resistance